MRKLLWLLVFAVPICAQIIDPRTQLNWPRVSGNGDPVTAGFGADCGTHYGQPYTDKSGHHYWVCGTSGWFQVDAAGGPTIEHEGTLINQSIINLLDASYTPPAGMTKVNWDPNTGSGAWGAYVESSSPKLQMVVQGLDSTHVFVPFGSCTPTQSGVSAYAVCDATSGAGANYRGGIFGYGATSAVSFTGATLPSWLPAANVTTVSIVAWTEGSGLALITNCSGSGTCGSFSYPPNNSQIASPVSGVTGSTIGSLVASASMSNGPYCSACPSPFTYTGSFQVTQIGLLVGFSGVTKPADNTLNINWPLTYLSDTNTLGVSQYYPNWVAPILTADIPSTLPTAPNNFVYWTSDNTQTTLGQPCTGSGTAGDGFALCRILNGNATLLAVLGGTAGTGTVTSVGTGTGLTGGPVTTTGTISCVNATSSVKGCVQVDGTTITASSGVISAVSGSVGPGTANFIPKFATTTTVGNSALDDGVTAAGTITSSEPIKVLATGLPTQFDMTYNAGHAPSGTAGLASWAPDSSGNGTLSENGAAYSRICTTANGACVGGASGNLQYNNTTMAGDPFTNDDGAGNLTIKTLNTTGTGSLNATEGTAPVGAPGHDKLYADSTAHRFLEIPNNSTAVILAGTTAARTAGHCAQFDSNGIDLVDAGGACGVAGGGAAFSAITAGVNTSGATMTVGNTTTLTPSGTGIVNANQINGATVPATTGCLGSNGSSQLVAGSCGTAALPFSIVQEGTFSTGVSSPASLTYTFPKALAASGNTAFMFIASSETTYPAGCPSGWTIDIDSINSTTVHLTICHKASDGSTSTTFTFLSGDQLSGYFMELAGTRAVDQSSSGHSAAANSLILPGITTTANSLVFGLLSTRAAASQSAALYLEAPSIDPTWHNLFVSANSNGAFALLGREIIGASGTAYTPPPLSPNTAFVGSGGMAWATFNIK